MSKKLQPENIATDVSAEKTEMRIEWWPIERLRPYPKNARKWSAAAVQKVAASIKEFGWRQPIVCDVHDVIVIGHLRLAAARYLSLTEVPVHVAADLSAAQIKALRIADNRTHEEAEWDSILLGQDLIDLKIDNFDLHLTWLDMSEISGSIFGSDSAKKTTALDDAGLEFKIVVDCNSEQHQAELLTKFKHEGLKCRALIS